MRRFALALMLSALALTGARADESCEAQASDKKLVGAALTSFMRKCENNAKVAYNTQVVDKKLSGATKDSFTKKCVKDASGA